MKKHTIYTLMILVFLCAACQKEDSVVQVIETPVVEAFLYAGLPVDNIKVTLAKAYNNEDSILTTLDDLEIRIADEDNTYVLDAIGEGLYKKSELVIKGETFYTITFEYNDATISSDTYVPGQQAATLSTEEITLEKIVLGSMPNFENQPDPIEINWTNSEGDYYYVVVNNIEDDPEYVDERLENGATEGRRFQFISEPEVMDFYGIDARREIQQFGLHEVIIFRVNPEYASLYESAGNTSSTLTQPPTNIVNGLGIFTGVSSDTLYFNVKKG